ncbi:WD domain G-beta repeat family protein [Babesia bovis T2Bo]|uniref:WD domain G-beta repeat family protein n=1 Tax=Babesia bovis T2Bo TaxID=484906 RepID=UPI001C3652A4|nr:WD domain G-beta repeat family protein [Babesia bovis T2Bo]EDO08718.2 WD domain G-beta repeat family protein [Babesia bovis T2Bo]
MQILDSGSNSSRVPGPGVAFCSLGAHFNTLTALQSPEQSIHRFATASNDYSASNRIVVVDFNEENNSISLFAQSSPTHPIKQLLDFDDQQGRLRFLASVRELDPNAGFVRVLELDNRTSELKVVATTEPLATAITAIAITQDSKRSPGYRIAVVHPESVALLELRAAKLEQSARYELNSKTKTTIENSQQLYSHRFITGKFDPHHKDIFACACENGFRLFDWRQLEANFYVGRGNCHTTGVVNIDFNPNVPNELATAGDDGKIAFWDLRSTTEPIEVLEGYHKNSVQYALFNSFHDNLMLSGGPSATLLNVRNTEPKLVHQTSFTSRAGAWSLTDAWHFAALVGNNIVVESIPSALKYKLLL